MKQPLPGNGREPGPAGPVSVGRCSTGRTGSDERVLRPGVMIPLVGYLAGVVFTVLAVFFTVIAPEWAPPHRMPPHGHWASLGVRFFAGEMGMLFVWFFFKIGSNRIILGGESMRIVTWGLCWTVRRDEMVEVVQKPSALVFVLSDGCQIRPSTFWSTPTGTIYTSMGWFKNAMSRQVIREAVMEWRRGIPGNPAAGGGRRGRRRRVWPCRRHWRVRGNWLLLAGLTGMTAVVAVLATAFI